MSSLLVMSASAAPADKKPRVGDDSAEYLLVDRLRPGGVGQERQLFEGLFHLERGGAPEPHSYQEGFLAGYLEVFNGGGEPTALSTEMLVGHCLPRWDGTLEVLALVEGLLGFFFGDYL